AERWAISYFVLSFSAWADPLTGEKLKLSPQTKAALDSPDVRADHPRLALDPEREAAGVARVNGKKPRVYYPGVRELGGPRDARAPDHGRVRRRRGHGPRR